MPRAQIRTCYVPKGKGVVPVDCLNSEDSASCGGPVVTITYPPFVPQAPKRPAEWAKVAAAARVAQKHALEAKN